MSIVLLAPLIGLGVGLVVGALGAGGGILSVPILVYVLGQEPHTAAAESLVIVIMTALVALPGRNRRGQVLWREGIVVGMLSTLGAVGGSWLNALVAARVLMLSFAGLLCVMAVVMLHKAVRERRIARSLRWADAAPRVDTGNSPWWVLALAASATGVLTGFFGVGGGFVVVPMLTIVLGMDMRRASGTSLVVMTIAAVASLAQRMGGDTNPDWTVTLCFTAGSMLGGVLGGPVSQKAPHWLLTGIFGLLLAIVAVVTSTQSLLGS